MKSNDWTPSCIRPFDQGASIEAIREQRLIELRDLAAYRIRHDKSYEAWSSAPIPYDPEWDNPKWDDEPMPKELMDKYELYLSQQNFFKTKAWQAQRLEENEVNFAKLGPIIRNPDYKPEEQVRLAGISLTPLFKPQPKLSAYQRFKQWLTR